MQNLPRRKSPRLVNYDYSQSGAYFVTICTYGRMHLFGEVHEGEMHLSGLGQITADHLSALPAHFDEISLDLWVVMPNHLHVIMVIDADGRGEARPYSVTLGSVINAYKGGVTRGLREYTASAELKIWQGRYHDHIIRNERSLNNLREYVLNNPARWEEDRHYGEG